jgi:[ribosomal protein S18]-alanine N-acetyltransferase
MNSAGKSLSETIEVRPMLAADVDQVMAIAEDLSEAPHWPQSAYLYAIDPKSSPRRIAFVATAPRNDSVVGFAIANLLPPQAELETIAVAPEHRQQGIGSLLLSTLAADLKAAKVQELLLEVRASNHPARAFYQAFGFAQTGLRSAYYTDPIEDAVLMQLTLT